MPRRRSPEERAEAVRLRSTGHSIPEIAAALGIARSTIWKWVGDVPLSRPRRSRGPGSPGSLVLRRREMERLRIKNEAARTTMRLRDERALLALGAIAYWCEGAKDKSYDRREWVTFCNSDPMLIRLFVNWLALVGVDPDRLSYRLHIHETADVPAGEQFWADVLEIPLARLDRTTVKRSQIRTNRRNRTVGYHGVLAIRVKQSRELCQSIEGWMRGAADSMARASDLSLGRARADR